MTITGEALIGGMSVRGEGAAQRAFNPGTEQQFGEEFNAVSVEQVNDACRLAGAAFDTFRSTSDAARAELLDAIARNIMDLGTELVERAMAETGLPQARLEGERGRTVGQLRLFAKVVRDGRFQTATLDSALPDRVPAPRPDLRLRKIGLGRGLKDHLARLQAAGDLDVVDVRDAELNGTQLGGTVIVNHDHLALVDRADDGRHRQRRGIVRLVHLEHHEPPHPGRDADILGNLAA